MIASEGTVQAAVVAVAVASADSSDFAFGEGIAVVPGPAD